MRLTRYVSRRLLRFLQYLLVGVCLVLMVPVILNYNRFPDKTDSGQVGFPAPPNLPGMIVAPDSEKQGKPPVSDVDLGQADPKDPSARFRDLPRDRDWHNYGEMKSDAARSGPGEQGKPVALPKDSETQKLEDQIYRVNGFDGLVSDQISLNRSIKDIRHPECRRKKYLRKLPTVTVILPFHNEHNSTLLRSVYSVINRSPREILKEIVLVDDASTKEFLKAPLQDFLNKVGLASVVKVVRAKKREGLIRARQIGAQHATSEIMIFLDSHSEPNYNWLPPLIEPIALDYRTAVCPFVDVIDCDTFEYRAQDEGARGSFDWEFNYKRLPLLPEDLKDPTKPFNSPVMAGGYFAISRQWFWELGGYDEGLDIWGGEQYELSFKIWQCHGKLVDAGCSRVGHIYRCKYVPFPNPGVGDFISRNYKRVAEVWMDEYKEHLFKRRTALKRTDPGDMSKQKAVRERLKCKPFSWFMKEIAFDQDKYYPAIEPPDGASGEVKNKKANKCIDTQFKGKQERFGLRTCISESRAAGGEQNMRMSFWKDIRPMHRSMCFDVSSSVKQAPVVLFPCHGMGGNQQWKYRVASSQLFHSSGQCLDCDPERGELFMNPCDNVSETQKWLWEHLNETVLNSWKY